jgi:hypothetical protein
MADEREPTLNRAPQVTFSYHDVQPPTPLYVSIDDTLVVWAVSSVAQVGIGVDVRILTPDGQIRPTSQQLYFPGDRTSYHMLVNIPEGFILSLTVGSITAPILRGQLYVQAWLARGNNYTASISYGLVAGYLTNLVHLSWPPGIHEPSTSGRGLIRHIQGTDPAAGVEISETCPTNTMWRVIGFNYTLITSAVAGNRYSHLVVDDGTTAGAFGLSGAVQAASTTTLYKFGAYGAMGAAISGIQSGVLPPDLYLLAGHRIRTSTLSLDAGDNYSAPFYSVEEWLDV